VAENSMVTFGTAVGVPTAATINNYDNE
jgi:hypothetical protein